MDVGREMWGGCSRDEEVTAPPPPSDPLLFLFLFLFKISMLCLAVCTLGDLKSPKVSAPRANRHPPPHATEENVDRETQRLQPTHTSGRCTRDTHTDTGGVYTCLTRLGMYMPSWYYPRLRSCERRLFVSLLLLFCSFLVSRKGVEESPRG